MAAGIQAKTMSSNWMVKSRDRQSGLTRGPRARSSAGAQTSVLMASNVNTSSQTSPDAFYSFPGPHIDETQAFQGWDVVEWHGR